MIMGFTNNVNVRQTPPIENRQYQPPTQHNRPNQNMNKGEGQPMPNSPTAMSQQYQNSQRQGDERTKGNRLSMGSYPQQREQNSYSPSRNQGTQGNKYPPEVMQMAKYGDIEGSWDKFMRQPEEKMIEKSKKEKEWKRELEVQAAQQRQKKAKEAEKERQAELKDEARLQKDLYELQNGYGNLHPLEKKRQEEIQQRRQKNLQMMEEMRDKSRQLNFNPSYEPPPNAQQNSFNASQSQSFGKGMLEQSVSQPNLNHAGSHGSYSQQQQHGYQNQQSYPQMNNYQNQTGQYQNYQAGGIPQTFNSFGKNNSVNHSPFDPPPMQQNQGYNPYFDQNQARSNHLHGYIENLKFEILSSQKSFLDQLNSTKIERKNGRFKSLAEKNLVSSDSQARLQPSRSSMRSERNNMSDFIEEKPVQQQKEPKVLEPIKESRDPSPTKDNKPDEEPQKSKYGIPEVDEEEEHQSDTENPQGRRGEPNADKNQQNMRAQSIGGTTQNSLSEIDEKRTGSKADGREPAGPPSRQGKDEVFDRKKQTRKTGGSKQGSKEGSKRNSMMGSSRPFIDESHPDYMFITALRDSKVDTDDTKSRKSLEDVKRRSKTNLSKQESKEILDEPQPAKQPEKKAEEQEMKPEPRKEEEEKPKVEDEQELPAIMRASQEPSTIILKESEDFNASKKDGFISPDPDNNNNHNFPILGQDNNIIEDFKSDALRSETPFSERSINKTFEVFKDRQKTMVETRNLDFLENMIEKEITRVKRSNNSPFQFYNKTNLNRNNTLKPRFADPAKTGSQSSNLLKSASYNDFPTSKEQFENKLKTDKKLSGDPVARLDFVIDYLFKQNDYILDQQRNVAGSGRR